LQGWSRRLVLRCAAMLLALGTFAGVALAGPSVAVSSEPGMLTQAGMTVVQWIWKEMQWLDYLVSAGPWRDVLAMLVGTAAILPLTARLKKSPIFGLLVLGVLMGPYGFNIIHDFYVMHHVAELGVIFDMFETGLYVSARRLYRMRRDILFCGLFQFFITAGIIAGIAGMANVGLNGAGIFVVGCCLTFSPPAFVLPLIHAKHEINMRYAKATLGTLLTHELSFALVLAMIPLLAESCGHTLGFALMQAGLRGLLSLGLIWVCGKAVLNKIFHFVTKNESKEAFLSLTLGVVLMSSAVAQGLGLSFTLGGFLGGMLLAGTKYVHQIEMDIKPMRGMLLGLFFVTVGYTIDLSLVLAKWKIVLPMIPLLMLLKIAVLGGICLLRGISGTATIQAAMLLAPGSEFAIIAFDIASRINLIPETLSKLLIAATTLSMALTPLTHKIGEEIAARLRASRGARDQEIQFTIQQLSERKDGFVVVCGYGATGKFVCQLLESQGVGYVVLDPNPLRAITAHRAGKPVFMADFSSSRMLFTFKVYQSKLVIIAISNKELTNRVGRALSDNFPEQRVLAYAKDDLHSEYLRNELGVAALAPPVPAFSDIMQLPMAKTIIQTLDKNDPRSAALPLKDGMFAEAEIIDEQVDAADEVKIADELEGLQEQASAAQAPAELHPSVTDEAADDAQVPDPSLEEVTAESKSDAEVPDPSLEEVTAESKSDDAPPDTDVVRAADLYNKFLEKEDRIKAEGDTTDAKLKAESVDDKDALNLKSPAGQDA